MGNINFLSKPRHVTPQINHLRKTNPVLMVTTHISGISKEIDGQMFIFQSKPRHVTPQINHLGKTSPVLRVSHTFIVFQGHRWENIHFSTKPRHVTPQIDCLGKTSTVLRVSTHIYGVSQEIDGKHHF